MTAYYNEIDPYAAQWLRNLIDGGHIAAGDVDERSIVDVRADDLRGYTQCHFFAGIGGWSIALRLAGWPDDRPVWTGSCPCQPFSLAGKQAGYADDRHLWPTWARLIKERRPPTVYGEQVASATKWLRLVRSDLEALGYAVGAIPIEAASAGADHLRDRYWFVAHADSAGLSQRVHDGRIQREALGAFARQAIVSNGMADSHFACEGEGRQQRGWQLGGAGGDPQSRDGGLADSGGRRCGGPSQGQGEQPWRAEVERPSDTGRDMGDGGGATSERDTGSILASQAGECGARGVDGNLSDGPPDAGSPAFEWVIGADGKARRVKPGIRLLAHGIPARVGKLRAFGNAIDPRPAAAFIGASMNPSTLPVGER